MIARSSWFQRFLLPAFAFKAVIIGGGYATGRELAEFFLPSGPWGGLLGILLAMVIWSVVCVVTFLFARETHSWDYRTFFSRLMGRFGVAFEAAYFAFVVLILAVFGAAAGAIASATFGLPALVGTILLMVLIAGFTVFGNAAVEQLFKYVSIFIYGVYAVFLVLCLTKFGDRIATSFAAPIPVGREWAVGGLTYAGYNIIGAVVILPMIRHLTSRRDAVIAGLICGPLAMLPAAIFFACMMAYYPGIGQATLPSDVLLRRLDLPVFRVLFQVMIFTALLESGTGIVHAVNERIAHAWAVHRKSAVPRAARLAAAAGLLVGSIFLANRFGLVELIAKGYRLLAWVFITVYVAPLLTVGVWRLRLRRSDAASPHGKTAPSVAEPTILDQRMTP
jgi:uncharacterized membrane protein YkvI